MNINEKIKLLSPIERGLFYLDVLDCISKPEWCEQYGIDSNLPEDHERAKELVYEERYHGYMKPILEEPKDAEELSLESLEGLAK